MLKGKHILLGITGGIAAYKIPLLVRDFKRAGAEVRIVMTEAAREFVTPLTLSTLSGSEVIVGTFPAAHGHAVTAGTWHIDLGRWAHVMVIAPATANVMAKLAHGAADDAVSTLALAARCPVLVSPAMDLDMWNHSATQGNVSALRSMGYDILPPVEGELASGLVGPGRLPELGAIMKAVDELLSRADQDLKGRKILVTAGPTQEAIDPVRYIGNRSSGKMGFALATVAVRRGADVTLITGRVHLPTPRNVKRIDVVSAREMFQAVTKAAPRKDAIIMAAAVADFTPASVLPRKLKKSGAALTLELKETVDILAHLGARKGAAVLVGFALETHNGVANAVKKLKAKHLDFILLNNPLQEGAGFDADTNVVTLIARTGKVERLRKMSKFDVAWAILDKVAKKL
jgi:phosphopantothenoylcysteine decarboxylase/phosphopantothenate--cysteine ligase